MSPRPGRLGNPNAIAQKHAASAYQALTFSGLPQCLDATRRDRLVTFGFICIGDNNVAGIRIKVLYSDDSGMTTALFKLDPGAVVPLRERVCEDGEVFDETALP